MISGAWKMLKDTVLAFIDDEALTRGAAIAFYTATSVAPVLLIVIAIAGDTRRRRFCSLPLQALRRSLQVSLRQ
jgi:membrane protein